MTRFSLSLILLTAWALALPGSAAGAHAAPATATIPRTTPSDFVFQVWDAKLWLAPNMRRVSNAPATFVVGKNPQFQYNGWLNACANDFSYFYVRMSASTDIRLRLMWIYYWLNDGQTHMELSRSVHVALAKDGGMHTYVFSIKGLHIRNGVRFRTLRLDPVEANGRGPSKVQIGQFRLISAQDRHSVCG